MFAFFSLAFAGPQWAQMNDASGWSHLADTSTKATGPIKLELKTIAGTRCLKGTATVKPTPAQIYEVVTDVPSAPKWSSETLLASEVLGRPGGAVDYYQHLDVPGWTMASDRFWVLRGNDISKGATKAFRWTQFDWKSVYPELAKRIQAEHSDAVEPTPNYGSWTLEPTDAGTRATYILCSNPGGSLPEWVQKTAATKTMPHTMADIMTEAAKR